ncbi:serine hydrolase domain-containing protein [Janthinobacterium lividum]|uniref:serine hydrolase domain-containing protein n=1 Tax=Janthinobacterium lividum TaxID=29581 RepID=UPI00089339CC|nr:serine hydrolase domain-containing protein [Janthinobacterium lividum]MCC7713295.1 serine hydrolase [Janthinobacterium lividum]OEZ61115.1 putative penicillin-binding protein PbpX [Janthinobacterium lividum]WQE26363.1 serine hydrolase domain-containing protein [Janthinobacterium lividum]STQ97257.1 Penicillin-binding protein E [Janthinobacterium lividum]
MRVHSLAVIVTLLFASGVQADALDDIIKAEMKMRQIPGLSLAIIENGKIVRAQGYGVTEKGGKTPVSPHTLFQAGSVSKPVAALGALHLVEQGKLALDEDVNTRLLTWKLPDSTLAAEQKVTLRRLLSHNAGLTVHGFPGYASNAPLPGVVQVLDGEKPANTAAIRVDIVPGSKVRYSGGGYTVMQQMVADVSGQAFPDYMRDAVLKPLGMQESSYLQPPPAERARLNASGHLADRSMVVGRWHVYPEMAAAGLWTNASDLARFAIGVQQSLAGTSNPLISAALTQQMLTPQIENAGLGVFLHGSGSAQRFSHGGRDEGFDTLLTAFSRTGQGAVIMINANDNSRMMDRLTAAIGRAYRWLDADHDVLRKHPAVNIDARELIRYTGRYELANNTMGTFDMQDGRLRSISDGLPDEVFVPVGPQRFHSTSRNCELAFAVDAQGEVTDVVVTTKDKVNTAPRIGPLMRTVKARTDPNPARTRNIQAVLADIARGGSALANSAFATAGIKRNFGTQAVGELAHAKSLTFLHEQPVAGRAIERHDSKVDSILAFRASGIQPARTLLVYLTADALFADFDLVDD